MPYKVLQLIMNRLSILYDVIPIYCNLRILAKIEKVKEARTTC